MKRLATLALMLCTSLLASCGGGGGGSSDDGRSPGSVTMTLTSNNISFAALGDGYQSVTSNPATIAATIANGSGTYYGTVVSDNYAVVANFTITGNTSGNVSATLIPADLFKSSGSGHLTVEVCADDHCASVVTSQQIDYTYVEYTVGTGTPMLTAAENGAPVSTSVAIQPAPPAGFVAPLVTADEPWLTGNLSSGRVELTANPAGLASGNYLSYVTLTSQAGQLRFPVSFTVGAAVGIAPRTIDVTAVTTASGLQGSTPVIFGSAATSNMWTATTTTPWLTVDTPNGVEGGNLTYTVDAAALFASAGNWSSTTGQITVSAPGLVPEAVNVTVNMQLAEIYLNTSGPTPSGTARTLTVSGRGLSQVSGTGSIKIDGANVTYSVGSDTSATISLPASVAGSHVLSVSNPLNLSTTQASAVVADAVQQPYALVSTGGAYFSASFDPYRQAVVALNPSQFSLASFTVSNGNWTATNCLESLQAYAIGPVSNIAYVYIAGNQSQAGYAINDSTCETLANLPTIGDNAQGVLAVTSNHRLWLGGFQYLDLSSLALATDTSSSLSATAGTGFNVDMTGSGDGALVLSSPTNAEPQGLFEYTASTDTFTQPSGAPGSPGGRLNFNHQLLVSEGFSAYQPGPTSFTHIGDIPTETGYSPYGSAMSADGSRVFLLEALASGVVDHISVYDATTISGGQLTKLGSIAVTDQANQTCVPSEYVCIYGVLVTDSFGLNVYWLGNKQMVVFPIPAQFQQLGLAANVMRRPTAR